MESTQAAAGTAGPAGRRRYDSTRRTQQAADTRRRVLEAAGECFSTRGFAATTLAHVAAAAGVSVETVSAHGPKRRLLLDAFAHAFTGHDDGGLVTRREPWASLLRAEPDRLLEQLADLVLAGQQRGTATWRALTAAAHEDPDVRALALDLARRRRADHLAAAEVLARRGLLRPERSVQQHADTLALLGGFDPYQLYVLEFGWSAQQLREWYVDTVQRLVLVPTGGDAAAAQPAAPPHEARREVPRTGRTRA